MISKLITKSKLLTGAFCILGTMDTMGAGSPILEDSQNRKQPRSVPFGA